MSARRPKMSRVEVTASERAVEGQMEEARGMSRAEMRVGRRMLEPEM
jgi:hypothetical protein